MIITVFQDVCGSTALNGISIALGSDQVVDLSFSGSININDIDNMMHIVRNDTNGSLSMNATREDLIHLVTRGMTLVAAVYEFLVAYAIILTVILLIVCCVGFQHLSQEKANDSQWEGLLRLLRLFMFIDSFAIMILGPFGNVYLFVLGCTRAYLAIAVRIGLYLSTISLPAVDSYLKSRDDPHTGELKLFVVILFKLALRLLTCSSCLATFIDIAYPERPLFRYTLL